MMPSPLPPAAITGPLSPPQTSQLIQPYIAKKENLRLSYEHDKTNSVSSYEYEARKWVYEPRQLPPQKSKLLAPPNTTNISNIRRTNQHRHPLNSAGMNRTNKQVNARSHMIHNIWSLVSRCDYYRFSALTFVSRKTEDSTSLRPDSRSSQSNSL